MGTLSTLSSKFITAAAFAILQINAFAALEEKISPPDETFFRFGQSVATNGLDTFITSPYNLAVLHYQKSDTTPFTFELKNELPHLINHFFGNWDPGRSFANDIALYGDYLLVGSSREGRGNGGGSVGSETGNAYIFFRNEGGEDNWGEAQRLTPSSHADLRYFGSSVAISETTIAVTSTYSVHIFEKTGDSDWEETRVIGRPENSDAFYGSGLAVHGDVVVVGANSRDSSSSARGEVAIYERNFGGEGAWGRSQLLTAPSPNNNDRFGVEIAAEGDRILIGCTNDTGTGTDNPGAAYLYKRNINSGAWKLEKIFVAADTPNTANNFGLDVDLNGGVAAISARTSSGATGADGAIYLYHQVPTGSGNWVQKEKITASDDGDETALYGSSISLNNGVLIVGDYQNRGYPASPSTNTGAAYAYEVPTGAPHIVGVPNSYTASNGHPGNIEVRAVGVSPLSFQWLKNDAPLEGQTGSKLEWPAISLEDAGTYKVTVTDSQGNITSSEIPVTVTADPPALTKSFGPLSQASGRDLTLTVTAEGSLPISVDWLKDGEVIQSGESSSFIFNAPTSGESGNYQVRLTNAHGVDESDPVAIEFNDLPPLIRTEHAPAFLGDESEIPLHIICDGSLPITYTWEKDGTSLPGVATPQIMAQEAGRYAVTASNSFGVDHKLVFTVREDFPLIRPAGKYTAGESDLGSMGYNVALEGRTIISGAYSHRVQGIQNVGGIARLSFLPSNQAGTLQYDGVINSPHVEVNANFGVRVAISEGQISGTGPFRTNPNFNDGLFAEFTSNPSGTWVKQQEIFPTYDGEIGSFATDGNLLAFARENGEQPSSARDGIVEVYHRLSPDSQWEHLQTIIPDGGGLGSNGYSYSIALQGKILVVGAPSDGARVFGDGPGAAHIFETDSLDSPFFTQRQSIVASDPTFTDLPFRYSDDAFGVRVGVNSDTIIVGTGLQLDESRGAYIFSRSPSGDWAETSRIPVPAGLEESGFGFRVAIDDNYAAVSASDFEDSRGKVYLYGRNQGGVDQWGFVTELLPESTSNNQHYGRGIALDRGLLVVGAPQNGKRSIYAYRIHHPPVLLSPPPLIPDPKGLPLHLNLAAYFGNADQVMGDEVQYSLLENGNDDLFSSMAIDQESQTLNAEFAPYLSGQATLEIESIDNAGYRERRTITLINPEIPQPEFTITSPLTLNRRTGLYELKIDVTNIGERAIGGAVISVDNLGNSLQVWPPSDAGNAFVFNNPVPGGETISLALEFFAPLRSELSAELQLSVSHILPLPVSNTDGSSLDVTIARLGADESTLLEVVTTPGKLYQFQYRDGESDWLPAGAPVSASANRLQWIDNGPPKTESHPSESTMRLYRVIENPEPASGINTTLSEEG